MLRFEDYTYLLSHTLVKVPSKEQVNSLSQELRSRATIPGMLVVLLYFLVHFL